MSGTKEFIAAVEAYPTLAPELAPGLAQAELQAFAEGLPGPLPEGFTQLYSWRNGEPRDPTICLLRWLGLEEIGEYREMWNGFAESFEQASPQGRIEAGRQWNRNWMPLMASDCNIVAVSLQPCFGYSAGLVIQFHFKGDDHWTVEATSFDAFLGAFAQLVRAGWTWTEHSRWSDPDLRDDGPFDRIEYGTGSGERRFEERAKPPRPSLTIGDRVRALRGRARNCCGIVDAVEPGRIHVLLDIFGTATPIWFSPSSVEPLVGPSR